MQVHQEYLKRRFVAPGCSIAAFLNVLIVLGAAILPLYIAWASQCACRADRRLQPHACTWRMQ
ncbi:hypothetical protein EON67_03285 [archaeon]|nr:MAG: hypothetical protein EON67_03285 [archaeon]